SPEAARSYCDGVRQGFPDTAIGALAYDMIVDAARTDSPSEFLALCEKAIDDTQSQRERRVALMRRLDYYKTERRLGRAALDVLRFWASYPGKVDECRLTDRFSIILGQAGFRLEAEAIAASEEPGLVARAFVDELSPLLLGDHEQGSPSGASDSFAYGRFYVEHTPNLDKLWEAVENGPASEDRALFLARVGCLAVDRLDAARSAQAYGEFSQLLAEAVAASEIKPDRMAFLESISAGVLANAERLFGKAWLNSAGSQRAGTTIPAREARRLLTALADCHASLLSSTVEVQAHASPEVMLAALDELVAYCKSEDRPEDAIIGFERFLAAHPDSAQAPGVMFRMCQFLAADADAPSRAVDAYAELAARYPESPETPRAVLCMGMLLIQLERYEDAYLVFQQFVADRPSSEHGPLARFLSASCEASMGLQEDAETHMLEVVDQFPQSPAAPRALYWMASTKMGRQEYAEAQAYFKTFIERYPDDKYAPRVRDYVERLEKVVEQ
ncbi:MAG: tetratricopeptide repeat protein, partial [Candidatus Hydrogenedentes bacterium]|nr:tetratricopeptide repeat protein [Candidatus Hydrogenedentota bacterium]